MVVFLSGLSSGLRASDALLNKVCEVFRNGFPIVQVADALFIQGTIFHYNGTVHLMQAPTFVATDKYTVLSSCIFHSRRDYLCYAVF